jgi:hypothetical protein
VDKARAYVKSEKAEQPKNNQNQSNKSKHVFVSSSLGEEFRKYVPREVRMAAPGESSRREILRGGDREVCTVRYGHCGEDGCERDLIE